MTTYYLKSQLTEKLGTDANLAEQIQILPQTEYSASGTAYLSASASYDGTVGDAGNAIYNAPPSRKYKYLSVKNTGANKLIVRAAQRLGTFSSLSVTYANGSVSGMPVNPTLQAVTAGASVDAFDNAQQFLRNGDIGLYISGVGHEIGVTSTATTFVINGTVTGTPATITGETISIQGFIVEPGQTITTKADGYMQDNLGDYPHCFTISYYNLDGATPAFDAQIFALEE